MNDVKGLLEKLKTLDAEKQAKAISNYMAETRRKKTVEDARRDVRSKCFAGCKKVTKQQQESFLYEYLAENAKHVNAWMREKHGDMFTIQQGSYKRQ